MQKGKGLPQDTQRSALMAKDPDLEIKCCLCHPPTTHDTLGPASALGTSILFISQIGMPTKLKPFLLSLEELNALMHLST